MTKTDELKAALIKLLFDQNGMANSIELVEALEVWIDAKAALPPPMVLGDNAKVIKGKVVKIDDPNELVRTYQQMVKRVA